MKLLFGYVMTRHTVHLNCRSEIVMCEHQHYETVYIYFCNCTMTPIVEEHATVITQAQRTTQERNELILNPVHCGANQQEKNCPNSY